MRCHDTMLGRIEGLVQWKLIARIWMRQRLWLICQIPRGISKDAKAGRAEFPLGCSKQQQKDEKRSQDQR
jgi:hypothetical protein